jgi:glycosyltransferase involved in cell wall biosynthesis
MFQVLKVSAIIPVYNPGSHIDDCVRTLLDQSLAADEYEVIFVDDGSTDGTPERLDELAAEHPNVRVEHIPNSGWPGRPRNVGMDLARGEFVYFVDNDDWLGHEALERLHAAALRDEADIVIGKVVGHGKYVPRGLFRRNRRSVTLEWNGLLGLLTPHKLFRRAFLEEHGIRFPEGRRRLEDHMFVVHAYFHAREITVLADYPCYHWVLRDGDANASMRPFDPATYYENLREVLDLVVEHTEPGPLRDRLLTHWYRGKMLGRVGGRFYLRREAEYRRELYEEVRRLALERYDWDVEAGLPFNLRVRSHVLRGGMFDALEALGTLEPELVTQVTVREVRRRGSDQQVHVEARVLVGEEPLRFARRGERLFWIPPEAVRGGLTEQQLDVTDVLDASTVQVLVRSTVDRSEYVVPAEVETRLVPEGKGSDDVVTQVVVARARVAPATGAAGAPLPPGDWDVFGVVTVAGFSATARARRPASDPLKLTMSPAGILTERRPPADEIPRLHQRVARRIPRLARLIKRATGAGGAAVRR